MTGRPPAPDTSDERPADGWGWTAAGLGCGVAAAAGLIVHLAPGERLADYPGTDSLLRAGDAAADLVFLAAAIAIVLLSLAARRRGFIGAWAAGLAGAAIVGTTLLAWVHAEAMESRVERTDLASLARLAAVAIAERPDEDPSQAATLPDGLAPVVVERDAAADGAAPIAGTAKAVAVRPTTDWIDAHHHRGNSALLLAGAVAAAAAVIALRGGDAVRRARRARSAAERAATAAAARARIAGHARDALAEEAGHVIRARLRETAAALDAATDPRADAATREASLRKVAASLSQAEAETTALLDHPGHTRVARAERDAVVELYASVHLEFPGACTIDLAKPVPAGALAEVQRELGSGTFAVITSDNPMDEPHSQRANQLRRGVLALELRSARLAHRPATGRSPDGSWAEQGFAVAVDAGAADALSELHGQRAYYWFDGSRFAIHETTGLRRTLELPRG